MKKVLRAILISIVSLLVIAIITSLLIGIPEPRNPNIYSLRVQVNQPYHLIPASGNDTLFLREWKPDSIASKKAVLIFHGVTAHSGAYDMIGNNLSNAGYVVFGLDYRGHGLSTGIRGDYESRALWVDDLKAGVAKVRSLGYDVVVLGHSLGVAAAMYLAKNSDVDLEGLVLLSGALEGRPNVRKGPGILKIVQILVNSVVIPSRPIIEYFREGMTGANDPLFNFTYTLRFSQMLDKEALTFREGMDYPILVGVGDQDELFTVESVRELYDMVPGDDKSFLVMEGATHAKFPDSAWDGVIAWLKERP